MAGHTHAPRRALRGRPTLALLASFLLAACGDGDDGAGRAPEGTRSADVDAGTPAGQERTDVLERDSCDGFIKLLFTNLR